MLEDDILIALASNGGNLVTTPEGKLIWVSPNGTRTVIAGA